MWGKSKVQRLHFSLLMDENISTAGRSLTKWGPRKSYLSGIKSAAVKGLRYQDVLELHFDIGAPKYHDVHVVVTITMSLKQNQDNWSSWTGHEHFSSCNDQTYLCLINIMILMQWSHHQVTQTRVKKTDPAKQNISNLAHSMINLSAQEGKSLKTIKLLHGRSEYQKTIASG